MCRIVFVNLFWPISRIYAVLQILFCRFISQFIKIFLRSMWVKIVQWKFLKDSKFKPHRFNLCKGLPFHYKIIQNLNVDLIVGNDVCDFHKVPAWKILIHHKLMKMHNIFPRLISVRDWRFTHGLGVKLILSAHVKEKHTP